MSTTSSFFRESNASMQNSTAPMKESLLTEKERHILLQQEQNNPRICPENQANWLSKITFQYVDDVPSFFFFYF
jgi:hypothetical protein